jgi:selenide,water dikinase
MIPGLIAGDYEYGACHVDLPKLCKASGAGFVEDRAIGIDLSSRRVRLEGQTPLQYDLLSIDVGSQSAAPEFEVKQGGMPVLPVKPLERFLHEMQRLWLRAKAGGLTRLAVVGGGAAGAELALGLHYRMNRAGGKPVAVAIVSETRHLLPERQPAASRALEALCRARGIGLLLGGTAGMTERGLTLAGAGQVDAEAVIWSTGAAAPGWLRTTGLATDSRGFLAVNGCLQSTSHPDVYASGDCASQAEASLPRSGVTAVRQGGILAANLARALAGQTPRASRLSPHALAILNCGGGYGLASWRGATVQGRWVWRWKNRLDQRFMRRFA